jgi:methylenetetrahydrofolate reductase (NADPH)
MKISQIFKAKKPVLSFEIFPPKLDVPLETIYGKLEQFAALKPDFISVTYGAGGNKKDRTIEIASKIKNEYEIESMAHFTCVGHTIGETDSMLETMHQKGLKNILALRGDPPADQPGFDYSQNAFPYAKDLIHHIRQRNDFCISAAAYVEGHIDSKRIKDDICHLKAKVDAGADILFTQLFFDNRLFFDFYDRLISLGINCPVVPGIMPIFKADQIKRIAALCGASIPAKLVLLMDKYRDNPDDMLKAGIEYAARQICELVENGADGIHLMTMNRPKSTKQILEVCRLL